MGVGFEIRREAPVGEKYKGEFLSRRRVSKGRQLRRGGASATPSDANLDHAQRLGATYHICIHYPT